MFPTDEQRERLIRAVDDPDADPVVAIREMTDSEELHQVALYWNWDDNRTVEVMRAVLEHPGCDRGTALYIYWLAADVFSEWHDREEVTVDWCKVIWDLALYAEQRLLSDSFAKGKILVDPGETRTIGRTAPHDTVYYKTVAKRPIPDELLAPTAGMPQKQVRLYE